MFDLNALKDKIFCSKDDALKKQFEQDVLMDDFMEKLKDINYLGSGDIGSLKAVADRIDSLHGWPCDPEKFWDIEAPFWYRRVDVVSKSLIADELGKFVFGRVLNIGSGSSSYVDSVNLDISFEMLSWNPSDIKVQADALSLPFKDKSFDSAAVVFVANYIKDLPLFVSELRRVLKDNGNVLFVQGKSINRLHMLAENKNFSLDSFAALLRSAGFLVRKIEKDNLIFLRCKRVL